MSGYVYLLKAEGTPYYKIGFSADNPWRREKELQTGSPFTLEMFFYVGVDSPKDAELALHQDLWECHHQGEWYSLTDEDVSKITNPARWCKRSGYLPSFDHMGPCTLAAIVSPTDIFRRNR